MSITVTNAIDSSDEVCPGGCPSWIIHWENYTEYSATRCSNIECDEEEDLVGAHVYREDEEEGDCYIIPLCRRCNKLEEEFEVYDGIVFVSDDEYNTCGVSDEDE